MPLRIDLTAGMNQNRADAINYAAPRRRRTVDRRYVINCSWRMNGDHAGVRTAIQNAVDNNVVVVYAAGNDNVNTDNSPQFPGVYPEVIAVAALDQQDHKATFSNFGTNVDVAAPGVNIWSSVLDGSHGFLDGTSMAAPHAAGVAALDLVAQPQPDQPPGSPDPGEHMRQHRRGQPGLRRHARAVGESTRSPPSPRRRSFRRMPRTVPISPATSGPTSSASAPHGVWVSLNNGNGTFQAPTKVVDNFAYEAGGWRVEKHPRFLADLTGDGRADIVGFGTARRVGVAEQRQRHVPGAEEGRRQLRLRGRRLAGREAPALPGRPDRRRRADIVGFGDAGVWVSLNNGNGTFQAPKKVVDNFAYEAGGWRVEKHPRFLADLTGDGRADIVGFGDAGVWVSLNNGNGTFQAPTKVVDNFAYEAGGWRVEKHPRFLADLTGDGRADIVGFGDAGVWVSLNNGNGTFQAPDEGRRQLRLRSRRLAGREAPALPGRSHRRQPGRHRRLRHRTACGCR